MKNRNLNHKDDWATPPFFYEERSLIHNFDSFDPCPFNHDIIEWNGLEIDWCSKADKIFINPPYSNDKETGYLKESFVLKAIKESKRGMYIEMLLPVSTSTKLFHFVIKPNLRKPVEFVYKRIPFIGVNSKGEYVNWHLWDREAPEGVKHVKANGQHDSMLITF